MSHNNHETNTGASRILFLSSADGVNLSGDPSLTTDFSFQLEQPILVPHHHAILMSLHRTSIPHTFYNFRRFRNCDVNVELLNSDNGSISKLDIQLEQANYNALDIVDILTTQINSWLSGATKTQLGTITNPITGVNLNLLFYMRYNRSELKFEWILSRGTNNNFGGMVGHYFLVFRWKSGANGTDNTNTSIMNEVGFIPKKWIDNTTYDFYCNLSLVSNGDPSNDVYRWGATDENGNNFTLKSKEASDFPGTTYKDLTWSGNILSTSPTSLPDGTTLPANTLKSVFSAVDVNYHIRSLYIKTNLTQHSVLNSKHGGRYSSILARLPNDVSSGETLEVFPRDGIQHKLYLKVREIDKIFIRLTDVNNRLMDLNGLDWNLSLQFDFIEIPEVQHKPPDLRKLRELNIKKREFNEEEKRLRQSGKKKELEEFLNLKATEDFENV
tara:strand:+ start:1385 stop:2710 length:1326 start_codon:yes stop_codon:yes gene_type:complete